MSSSEFQINVTTTGSDSHNVPVSFQSTVEFEGDWVLELDSASFLSSNYRLPVPFIVSGKIRIVPARISKNYQFFKKNKAALVEGHYNEEVVICNEEIVGFYEDRSLALEALKEKGLNEDDCCVITCNESEFKSNLCLVGEDDDKFGEFNNEDLLNESADLNR